VRALAVLGRQTGTGPGIAAVRELEALTASARTLADLRIVVGQFGGLSGLARQLVQALRHRSATVMASDEPDPATQARAANRFAATVYVGFEAQLDAAATICYYRVPEFESIGGRALAAELAARCRRSTAVDPDIQGMRLPVLRETRMPAVLFSLGDAQAALDGSLELVQAVIESLETWAAGLVPDDH
jgi:N-acetylmuramoyl-L-alanine amidase